VPPLEKDILFILVRRAGSRFTALAVGRATLVGRALLVGRTTPVGRVILVV
jgi:hypothetical protein